MNKQTFLIECNIHYESNRDYVLFLNCMPKALILRNIKTFLMRQGKLITFETITNDDGVIGRIL